MIGIEAMTMLDVRWPKTAHTEQPQQFNMIVRINNITPPLNWHDQRRNQTNYTITVNQIKNE